MSIDGVYYVAGITTGIVICGISSLSPYSTLSISQQKIQETNALISECEKLLPRNQNCMIVAIPKAKNDDD